MDRYIRSYSGHPLTKRASVFQPIVYVDVPTIHAGKLERFEVP
jgi:hypothetical protein